MNRFWVGSIACDWSWLAGSPLVPRSSIETKVPSRAGCGGHPARVDPEILWTVGEDTHDTSAPLHLDADVWFFMENGRYDVLIRSDRRISESGGHDIAGCWSSSSLERDL